MAEIQVLIPASGIIHKYVDLSEAFINTGGGVSEVIVPAVPGKMIVPFNIVARTSTNWNAGVPFALGDDIVLCAGVYGYVLSIISLFGIAATDVMSQPTQYNGGGGWYPDLRTGNEPLSLYGLVTVGSVTTGTMRVWVSYYLLDEWTD